MISQLYATTIPLISYTNSMTTIVEQSEAQLTTPGLSGFWDQSRVNSALYIAFWSVEPTDYKNVIVENIPPALSL